MGSPQAPIYATLPVQRLGRMALQDEYLSRVGDEDFVGFTLDEVDAAFHRIVPLRWRQTVHLSGRRRCKTLVSPPLQKSKLARSLAMYLFYVYSICVVIELLSYSCSLVSQVLL